MNRSLWCILVGSLIGCGSSTGGGAVSDASTAAGDGQAGDAGATTGEAGAAGDAAGATNTISGSVGGKAFDTIATALWIGAPDDATTTVVYVFSNPVDCAKLSPSGWADDGRVPAATQFLEMKMKGSSPGSFKIVTGAGTGLAAGEASVNHSLTASGSPSAETLSTGGTVTIASIQPSTSVTGTFDVKFAAGAATGAYNATSCPKGTEP